MIDADLIPWIFGAVMTAGLIYLLVSILFGEIAEMDADVNGGGVDGTSTEARGLGCSVISAGLAGFGSVGLMGSLSGWSLAFSLLAGLIFGLIFGRTALWALRFVIRQQYNDLITTDSLIGAFARMTIDTPAGKVGEAMVESDTLIKYPVQATRDDIPLRKGDYVEIVDIKQGRLFVKKKRGIEDSILE